MTSLTRKVISTITSAYKTINSSTLNGAIDIVVVKQEDGTLRCTPFHVRYGKLGVLQSQQTKVYITVNDVPVDDLYMQLGEAGEAAFLEENLNTPVLPPMRHLEPSDSSAFLDPDNALALSAETNGHAHLSNIDCSPQIVNKQLDQDKTPSEQVYAYEQNGKPSIKVDVLNSTTHSSVRRRFKRRPIHRHELSNKAASEEDEQDLLRQYTLMKRRSRARKRDSAPYDSKSNISSVVHAPHDEPFHSTIKLLRKRSASETDLPFFQIYADSMPMTSEHSRFHSIDSRPKTLVLNSPDSNERRTTDDGERKASRASSIAIPIDQSFDSSKTLDETDDLLTSVLSKSAPTAHMNTTNGLRLSQSDDPTGDFFSNGDYSPNSSYESALSPRPTSPKSDTEYELDKSTQQAPSVGWQWKWGEFPEQRRSVFRYLWPSSKKSTPKEGVYLDEITNNRDVDRSLYLPQLDYHQNPPRTTNDDDQESGTGHSIPQSPFRENEASYLLGDAQLSLCGNNDKQSSIPDEVFNAHLVSFETFATNPAIVNDPNLVVRIAGKYYNWNVASALITSTCFFNKPLPVETIEQLQEKHMPPSKPRSTASGGWWPFSGKKSDMKNDSTKMTTPSEVLAVAAKSDVAATGISRQNSMEHSQPAKHSKTDNESEPEDREVGKITTKIEQAKDQQRSTPSHQSSTFRKKMILSSEELNRLNLKLGKNKVEFSVTTAWQGTTTIESNIFLFDHMTKFVISDIDGTITRSDVLGHIIPLVGGDWSHDGIAEFYNAIQENGYQFIYLSARAIGQSQITRNFLSNVKQSDRRLPSGPLLISPDTLMTAFYREVIAKKPEDFKIECLKNIASLFPGKNPFYAGFGNRINDQWAYTAVGIPVSRIYTINPSGEVVRQKLSQALSTSYKNLHEIVDLLFPPMDSFSASETYSVYTYWREEALVDPFEAEMRAELTEIAKRPKATRAGAKPKVTSTSATTTPTTGTLPKTTPTTTVLKPGGEKLLTLAQATENTVKRA